MKFRLLRIWVSCSLGAVRFLAFLITILLLGAGLLLLLQSLHRRTIWTEPLVARVMEGDWSWTADLGIALGKYQIIYYQFNDSLKHFYKVDEKDRTFYVLILLNIFLKLFLSKFLFADCQFW